MTALLDDVIFSRHPDLKRLRRVLQLCKGFGLYFARCNTLSLRHELVAALKADAPKPIIELPLNPENNSFIDAQITALLADAGEDAVVFVYDLEKLIYLKDRHVIQELNWRRGFYGRLNHPVVFWLPEFLLTEIFNQAPDFADWYSGIYEFSLSEAERLNLMAGTWQSVNESFVGQLSLAEKERWIINLQNLLAELGEQENSSTKGALLNRLGLLYDSLGSYDEALLYYQHSLKIQQDIGDQQGLGATLNNLAGIAQAIGDYDTALHYLTQAFQISRDIGDKQGLGATLNNLATIAYAKGDYDSALRYLTQALQIRQDIGDKQGLGATLNNFAQIHHVKGDYDTALRYLMQALQISQDLGDKKGEGARLNNISQIYQVKGDYAAALRYLTRALQICQEIGDKQGECVTLFNIGHNHSQHGEQQLALSTWLKAYKIAKQIGLAEALENLDQLAKSLGEEGLAFWEALTQTTPA